MVCFWSTSFFLFLLLQLWSDGPHSTLWCSSLAVKTLKNSVVLSSVVAVFCSADCGLRCLPANAGCGPGHVWFCCDCRRNLTDNSKDLNTLDDELKQTTARVQKGNTEIASLREGVERLRKLAKELQDNATDIQARDVEGGCFRRKEWSRKGTANVCWGRGIQPLSVGRWIQPIFVEGDGYSRCLLRERGTDVCWGRWIQQISVEGDGYSRCLLKERDTADVCWGRGVQPVTVEGDGYSRNLLLKEDSTEKWQKDKRISVVVCGGKDRLVEQLRKKGTVNVCYGSYMVSCTHFNKDSLKMFYVVCIVSFYRQKAAQGIN